MGYILKIDGVWEYAGDQATIPDKTSLRQAVTAPLEQSACDFRKFNAYECQLTIKRLQEKQRESFHDKIPEIAGILRQAGLMPNSCVYGFSVKDHAGAGTQIDPIHSLFLEIKNQREILIERIVRDVFEYTRYPTAVEYAIDLFSIEIQTGNALDYVASSAETILEQYGVPMSQPLTNWERSPSNIDIIDR